MSFWWHRRDKSGKAYWYQIDFDPMIIVIVVGLVVAIIGLIAGKSLGGVFGMAIALGVLIYIKSKM